MGAHSYTFIGGCNAQADTVQALVARPADLHVHDGIKRALQSWLRQTGAARLRPA
ncbi:hypothetical protein [Candidatus Accumulibacter contiguus]|jgi:hypothetical protein|uniref:Uncharacterized protein n=1 Tax=Candidatus Accumulibacter phosphatis TaxID=327160 RepID=A0A080LWS1_9PROT|nr:MAG: hypothetical protein AW09_002539 [Candidatus Accumulibacter phosphatis]